MGFGSLSMYLSMSLGLEVRPLSLVLMKTLENWVEGEVSGLPVPLLLGLEPWVRFFGLMP